MELFLIMMGLTGFPALIVFSALAIHSTLQYRKRTRWYLKVRDTNLLEKFPAAYTWSRGDELLIFYNGVNISEGIKNEVITPHTLAEKYDIIHNVRGNLLPHNSSVDNCYKAKLIKILPDGVVMKCVDENYTGDGKEFFVFANFIHSNTSANQRNLIAYPENELEFFNDKISTLKELSRI